LHTRRMLMLVAVLTLTFLLLPSGAHADSQWIKSSSNPVLGPTPNSWDAYYTTTPRVIYDGKVYRMWYSGGTTGSTGVGYAISNDGISWSKHTEPVLSPGLSGAWDSSSVALGSVLWNKTVYMMWYTGSNPTTFANGAVGLATSEDGATWTKYPGNPVLTATAIDQAYIATPHVIKLGLTYNMWYTGRSTNSNQTSILYATSFDGANWSKWPHAVFSPSPDPNAWDSAGVYSPSVYFNGTNFWLWYSGLGQNPASPQIGMAISPDGATWTRYASNPILGPGAQGTWDSAGVEQPNLPAGDGLMIYYDGITNNAVTRIGLAGAPQGFAIPEFAYPPVIILLGIAVCAVSFLRKRDTIR
jgi:predicted GH43/DUF377 family glycosyl hydrolase